MDNVVYELGRWRVTRELSPSYGGAEPSIRFCVYEALGVGVLPKWLFPNWAWIPSYTASTKAPCVKWVDKAVALEAAEG